MGHLHAINQLIEQCYEFNKPLCIGYIVYEKAFNPMEHKTIFKAVRTIGINETYITILEEICPGATARLHTDNYVSEDIPVLRGVKQGDPINPKLATATVQEVFTMPS